MASYMVQYLHLTRSPHAMKLVAHAVDLNAAGDVLELKREMVDGSISFDIISGFILIHVSISTIYEIIT